MPSKYGFGDTRKKNAPTYMKSSGFKMKGSPNKMVAPRLCPKCRKPKADCKCKKRF